MNLDTSEFPQTKTPLTIPLKINQLWRNSKDERLRELYRSAESSFGMNSLFHYSSFRKFGVSQNPAFHLIRSRVLGVSRNVMNYHFKNVFNVSRSYLGVGRRDRPIQSPVWFVGTSQQVPFVSVPVKAQLLLHIQSELERQLLQPPSTLFCLQ